MFPYWWFALRLFVAIHYLMPWLLLAIQGHAPEAPEQGHLPKPAEFERIKVALGQQELSFD